MDDEDTESEHSLGFLLKSSNKHHVRHHKPPIIVPGNKRTARAHTGSPGLLWSTGPENDMHHLEESYRMATYEAQLHRDTNRSDTDCETGPARLSGKSCPRQVSDTNRGEDPRDQQEGRVQTNQTNSIDPLSDEKNAEAAAEEEEKAAAAAAALMETSEKKKASSKSKASLQSLNKFVLGHTSRKVTSNWDLVENKFQASLSHDIVIVKGPNGIGNPIKVKTLPLSSLTLLLCSSQLQLKFKELNTLYTTMKFSPDDVVRSCKIAARKLVLMASTVPEVQLQCQAEITNLLSDGEPKIRIDTLLDCVFSSDPADRKKEMAELEKSRAERVQNLNDEKRRKKENLTKIEARKKKSIFDFELAMGSVQYPRGLMNDKRLEHLRAIINFAYDILLEEFYEKAVAVDPLVVELLGQDMFPNTGDMGSTTAAATKEDIKAAALEKAGFVRKEFAPQSTRIDLVGPPTLVDLIRKAVALGKGIYGTSFNDVVELIQAYATTRMQAYYRGYTRRWRYRVARRAWKHLYNFMKSKIFKAWADEMRMMKNLRTHCFRKLTAWKYYTKNNLKRRHIFRLCYWPFFVWRRHAIETARIREKRKYLAFRLVPTYDRLRHFRAWKRYYLSEAGYNKPADKYYLSLLKKGARRSFHWWRYWLRRRKGLRRAWIERGYMMRCLKREDAIRVPFHLWRAATTFKSRTMEFVKRNAHKFRDYIFPDVSIHLPPVKIKLTEEDRKRLLEDGTLTEVQSAIVDTLNSKKYVICDSACGIWI